MPNTELLSDSVRLDRRGPDRGHELFIECLLSSDKRTLTRQAVIALLPLLVMLI